MIIFRMQSQLEHLRKRQKLGGWFIASANRSVKTGSFKQCSASVATGEGIPQNAVAKL
jgi:hypothetical protein